jgi:hypothetical protein
MSEENVEVVRQAIRHLNETGEPDWEIYDADLDDSLRWPRPRDLPRS